MNNYKMYMITGANTLYFLWANLPEKEIKLHIRDGETAEAIEYGNSIANDNTVNVIEVK